MGGALITFLIVLIGLPPSPDTLVDDAVALVPSDSEVIDRGANTGSPIIVGWSRWGTATFEDERSSGVVHQLMVERARDLGWTIDEVDCNQYGDWIEASTWITNAEIRIAPQYFDGDPLTSSRGTVTVSRNEDIRAYMFSGFIVAGGIAGGAIAAGATRPRDIGRR